MSMPIAQPDELIARIKTGDEDAFREFVKTHRGKAFGLSYSIVGNPEDARDILQEAFLRVYRNIKRFRGESSLSTWFYAIIVNLGRDHLRKKARQKEITITSLGKEGERFLREIPDTHLSPKRLVLTAELNRVLDKATQELSEKQRLAFIMKHINGLKTEEIARILRCRPGTVKVHLFRAVRNLRKKLSPYLEAEF